MCASRKRRPALALVICLCFFLLAFLTAFLLGNYPVDGKDVLPILYNHIVEKIGGFFHWDNLPLVTATWKDAAETAICRVRLPRILAAALIGGGLSAAGLCYQGLFRNPMVSPDVLGASAGAGFGAALGLFFAMSHSSIVLMAFGMGLLAVIIVQCIGSRVRGNQTVGLVLGGIMVGSLFSSGVSFLKLVADPDNTLPAITYWLMGDLSSVRMGEVQFAAVPILLGVVVMMLLRWRLNVLTLEEDEARSIGVDTRLLRTLVILASTLITAACVSVSGMIGWVGLVIPHFVRMLFGCDYRVSLPCSLLMGGGFLILVDDLARTISTNEVPLGILTSFVGAPFFLYLILREGKHK